MCSIFENCYSLTSVPLYDTSKNTTLQDAFIGCSSLSSLPLFDTSNVSSMYDMCSGCSSLTAIPLFNTSKIKNIYMAFYGCVNVDNGASALYQQVSGNTLTYYTDAFRYCGINTVNGTNELTVIPRGWGGTKV